MQILSYAFVAVFVAAVACLLVLLPAAIRRSVNHGQRFRDQLDDDVDRRRLSRMLALLGIDRRRYIATTPVVELRRQLRECDGCSVKARCDADLESAGAGDDAAYCPNQGAIRSAASATETKTELQAA